MTATGCDCGFTQRLIGGEVDITSPDRGKGLKQRYFAIEWIRSVSVTSQAKGV